MQYYLDHSTLVREKIGVSFGDISVSLTSVLRMLM